MIIEALLAKRILKALLKDIKQGIMNLDGNFGVIRTPIPV